MLPWICLGGGLAGLFGGLFLTVWTMAGSFNWAGGLSGYTYLISGKPFLALPQFVPIIFETTILLASFSAGLGMLALNALPMLYNPLFKSERFPPRHRRTASSSSSTPATRSSTSAPPPTCCAGPSPFR